MRYRSFNLPPFRQIVFKGRTLKVSLSDLLIYACAVCHSHSKAVSTVDSRLGLVRRETSCFLDIETYATLIRSNKTRNGSPWLPLPG